MQVCKHLSMKVCKYARGHLDPEQKGRLIGKGPLPKEKLMKALGEKGTYMSRTKRKISIGGDIVESTFQNGTYISRTYNNDIIVDGKIYGK